MVRDYIPSVNLSPGEVVEGSGGVGYDVAVSGVVMPAVWNLGYIPTVGDSVYVLLVNGRAVVIASASTAQRPVTGTISGSPSSGLVPVSTWAGTLDCRYLGTAPGSGSLVRLLWDSTEPWILPAVASAPPPTPSKPVVVPPPPPKPPAATGALRISAIDSGSYQVGGNWAAMGRSVRQWRYGGFKENRGAWFYGTRAKQLRGRTITRTQIWLPGRLRIGSYNQSGTAHFYRHLNATRPGGDVSRVGGAADATIGPIGGSGGRGQWYDLPNTMGQALVDFGGGIAIAGSPYLGFPGIDVTAVSGQLRLYWRR